MNIQKLKFSHFRNYDSASFSFEPAMIHVLFGRNAQGKTNILEGIYYLSHLRSFRTLKTGSLIEHDEHAFSIECLVERKTRLEDLRIYVEDHKKRLFRYGSPVPTASSFVGIVNAILFCPDDLNLFSSSPSKRRQFMDMELVKLSRTYTSTLSHYQKLLKDRNAALKAFHPDSLLIETLGVQMAKEARILIEQRASFLSLLEEKANEVLPVFSESAETLQIRYKTSVETDSENLEEALLEAYEKSIKKDKQTKNTSVGIHRDDIEFILNRKLLTQTASQGQKRTVLLALKIGLAKIIEEKSGQYPIMLLDDVFSELDNLRKAALIASLPKNMQVFITTSEELSPALFNRPVKFYTVENAKMKEGIYHVES